MTTSIHSQFDKYYLYLGEFFETHYSQHNFQTNLSNNLIAKLDGIIFLPKEKQKNPHVAMVRKQIEEDWLLKIKLIDKSQIEKIKSLNFTPLFSTPFNQERTGEHLFTSVKFISWLFLFDDIFDKNLSLLRENNINLHHLMDFYLNIMKKNVHLHELHKYSFLIKFPKFEAFSLALFDIRHDLDLIHEAGSPSEKYFLENLRQYYESILLECHQREKGSHASVNDYMKVRRHTGAVKLTFSLIALLKNIYLSSELTHSLEFQLLEDSAIDSLSLLNDIISYPKERNHFSDEEAHENIINTYQNLSKESHPLQDAIKQSIRLHNNRLLSFLHFKETIQGSFLLNDKQKNTIKEYAELMGDCIYDNAIWSVIETSRYKYIYDKNGMKTEIPMQFEKLVTTKKSKSAQEEKTFA